MQQIRKQKNFNVSRKGLYRPLITVFVVCTVIYALFLIIFFPGKEKFRSAVIDRQTEEKSSSSRFVEKEDNEKDLQTDLQKIRSSNSYQSNEPRAISDPEVTGFLTQISNQYQGKLSNKTNQLLVIEKISAFLKKKFPATWTELIYEVIPLFFPEKSDELCHNFKRLQDYQSWVDENYFQFGNLNSAERHERLMEERKRIFGEDAIEIWEAEIKAYHLYSALNRINDSHSGFEEMSGDFVDTLGTIYEENTDSFLVRHQQHLLDAFLGLDSVQNELHLMDTPTRHIQLTRLRAQMGLEPDALKRWAVLDQKRNDRWEKGFEYMDKRQVLLQNLSGDEQTAALYEIQDEIFGKTLADTIRNEESAGYLRFNQRQKFGLN